VTYDYTFLAKVLHPDLYAFIISENIYLIARNYEINIRLGFRVWFPFQGFAIAVVSPFLFHSFYGLYSLFDSFSPFFLILHRLR
jgi:hypothetical protein